MSVLPPGTILQLMYLTERLKILTPGRFIEIGPGSGEISSLLLKLGWKGVACDLEWRTVERLRMRFTKEISEGRYELINDDYFGLRPSQNNKFDLIISCMVMEHFTEDMETRFMMHSHEFLSNDGLFIGFVPASPAHWGIEDNIAGHYRRYTRDRLHALAQNNGWQILHIIGLTYPLSNILLPISNFLVWRAEKEKITMSNLEKTKASGVRDVFLKTSFPNVFSLVLNDVALLPFFWLQKLFSCSRNSLVLYFEAISLEL